MAKDFPPLWWSPDFSIEQLANDVMGKTLEDAMYTIFAADCECFVRRSDRESTPPPSSYKESRLQLFVQANKVINVEIG